MGDTPEHEDKEKQPQDNEERKSRSSGPTGDTKTEEIGEVLWCGSDVYLIIVSVLLVIFALFSFFGDASSKAIAGFKLLLTILFTAGVVYAVVKKNARAMGAVMIGMLVVVLLDIVNIFVALFGKSTFGEAFFAILFSLIRIAFFIHLFFVTNKIRVVYRNGQYSSLPK